MTVCIGSDLQTPSQNGPPSAPAGSATYLVSLAQTTAYLLRTDTLTKTTLTAVAAPGTTLPSGNKQYGSGWNYQGQIFFAENSGTGVYEVTFTQAGFAASPKEFVMRRIGSSVQTSYNDGTNCVDAALPYVAEPAGAEGGSF